MNPTFTARQIADALGMKRQAVQWHLRSVAPAAQIVVNGATAAAWKANQFPAALHELARARGYRDAVHAVSVPVEKPAPPAIALKDVDQGCIGSAVQLQRALRASLARKDDLTLSPDEFDRLGVEDYKREFGRTITGRHFRRLFKRTVDKAGACKDWARLELYLPDQPKRRAESLPVFSSATGQEWRELHELLASCRNPAAPSSAEKTLLWLRSFELLEAFIAEGRSAKKLRLQLLRFLWKHVPALADSPNGLRMSFARKLQQWQEGGRTPDSITDGREKRRGQSTAAPYDREQISLLKYTAATQHAGKKATALRNLQERGLITDARMKQAPGSSKSYVKHSLRAELTDVGALHVCHIGPKAVAKMTPSVKRTLEGLHSMEIVTGDDKTADVYVPVPDEAGWFEMLRPQILFFVDVRSMFVVGRVVIPKSQYSALDVLSGYRQVFAKWGLPRYVQREGGLWRKAKLVNSLAAIGNSDVSFSRSEMELHFERKGVRFVAGDADSSARLQSIGIDFKEVYQARGKVVERVIGVLSDAFEQMPGFCGREERLDCSEATKRNLQLVRSRKARPEDAGFLSWSEFISGVDAIISKYNTERQEGYTLRGLSPHQAFHKHWNTEDPPMRFDSECAMYLSHIRIDDVPVKAPNLRRKNFPCGYVVVRNNVYCNEETGHRIGRKLIAYFDPTAPESCTFTDGPGKKPFTVPRLDDVNGWIMDDQTKDSLAQARSPIAALKSDFRAMKANFEPLFRRNIVSPRTRELNQHIRTETAAVRTRQKEEQSLRARITRIASEVGYPVAAIEDFNESTLEALQGMRAANTTPEEKQ